MPSVEEIAAAAFARHVGGDVAGAEALYRTVLGLDPGRGDTLHLLGVAFYQRGRADLAALWLRRAVTVDDRQPDYHQNLALSLRMSGRLSEAAAAYARVLGLAPERADTYAALGGVHAGLNDFSAAVVCWRAALGVDPCNSTALIGLVARLRAEERPLEAAVVLRDALRRAPGWVDMLTNLGIVLRQADQLEAAEAAYRNALCWAPAHVAGLYGLADCRLRTDRSEAALTGFARILRLDPQNIDGLDGAARVYEKQLEYPQAAAAFRRRAVGAPGDHRVWHNLATTLENMGSVVEAATAVGRALRLERGFAPSLNKIGLLLNMCDWRDYAENEAAALRHIREDGGRLPMIPLVYMNSTPQDQLLSARRLTENAEPAVPPGVAAPRFTFTPGPREKLKIGYVSGDFREHAVAFLIVELLELHDRAGFEIIGYSSGPPRDQPMRRRLEAAVDRMVEIRDVPAPQAAQRIHDDGIDVLVDLSGHTLHGRHDVFSLRPAPVQVTWLGFPGATGADFFDYVLVDPTVAPPAHQPYYSERLFHLPDCYQPNDRKRPIAAETPSRAECGLPETGFVFCSFNHAPKITPEIFSVWMRILRAVPDSVLWLLAYDPQIARNLLREAAARGVDPRRLIFAPRLPMPQHLARFRVADLFLDTFPYNAHTTGSDSLWAGCPLLTCMGETFPSRVAASLLLNVGVPELITGSLAEYEAAAVALARDPARLGELRRRLEANRDSCPLFDAPRMTRNVEAAYTEMWRRYVEGAVIS